MTNYFFISSPLHFFIATNLAISHQGDNNIAIFISKNEETAQQYSKATRHCTDIFQQTYELSVDDEQAKFSKRKVRFAQLKALISSTIPDRIFTGSDRRMEFQFAMHQASKVNAEVEGIYIDDGTVSYLGHKSINSIVHQYIDPTLKKLIYGLWWKNPLTTGSSSWISKAYLAVKAVLCLPNESFYLKNPQFLQQIKNTILKHFQPQNIAIKAHPKSKDMALLTQMFPESIALPNTLGMELLLPKLSNDTSIIGDVSTALLTAKWLKPKVTVQAFEVNSDMSKQLKNLFHSLGITFLSLEPV